MNPILRKISFIFLVFGISIGVFFVGIITYSYIVDSSENKSELGNIPLPESSVNATALDVLDPPVIRTSTNFYIEDWNGDEQNYYAEYDSDGDKMIKFRTFANGVQVIFLDDGKPFPTKEELCLIHTIDITEDGSCLYQIAIDRIEALEELHATPGNPHGTTGSFELIPEPGDKIKFQEVQS